MGFTPEQLDEMERRGSSSFTAPKSPATTTKKKYTVAELDAMEKQSAPAQQEQPGFLKSVVQGLAKPFLRTASTPSIVNSNPLFSLPSLVLRKLGKESESPTSNKTFDYGYFGEVEPLGQKDNLWDNTKDIAGTALELASTVAPIGKIPLVAKATLAGKVAQGAKSGANAGLKSGTMYGVGSELQNDEATLGSVVEKGIVGGATGLATGGLTGGALPLPAGTARFAKSISNPEDYTGRVLQVSKPNYQKFIKSSGGETPEKFLTDRGITGTNEELSAKLYERFNYSKNIVDSELEKLGGTWTDPSLKAALKELVDIEAPTLQAGIQSQNSSRIMELAAKERAGGLTMSEINEVKRLFERNVKTGYLRENVAAKVKYATDIDSSLREWQLETARKLGLNNLDELNKETKLSRELADAIYRRTTGKADEGGLDFIDSVLIAGGDPYSVGIFAARKGLKSERLQASLANKLMGNKPPKIGMPTAKTRAPLEDNSRLLPTGNANTTNPIYMPPAKPKPLSQAEIDANNAFQAERQASWQTPLQLPEGNPNLVPGAPVPLRPRNTIEPPAKNIRRYDSLNPLLQESNPIQLPQRSQRSPNTEATPSTNNPTIANIPPSIPQTASKINGETNIYAKGSKFYVDTKTTSQNEYVEKLLTGVGRQRALNKQMLQSFYQDQQKRQSGTSGKIGIAPLLGLGGGSTMTAALSAPSTATYNRENTEEPQKGTPAQPAEQSGLDRKDLERRFVHVENRGAKRSGKNLYKTVGVTGDLGKYQVSPPSLADWSEPWLGKKYTKEEFLADPQAQEDFFNEFLNMAEKYKLTPDEIAIAWHTGWGELGTGSRETREDRFRVSIRERMNNPRYKKYVDTFNELD